MPSRRCGVTVRPDKEELIGRKQNSLIPAAAGVHRERMLQSQLCLHRANAWVATILVDDLVQIVLLAKFMHYVVIVGSVTIYR